MTITLESISELLERGFIDAYDDPGQVKASIDAAIRERDRLRGDVSGMTEELLHVPSREEWRALQKRAERAEAELAESRETIKRLNRRVQVAEAGVAEKVKVSAPGSLGRALANASADRCMRERDEAQAELAALKALLRECEPIISAYAESLHLTDGFRRRPHECDGLAEQVRAAVKVEE